MQGKTLECESVCKEKPESPDEFSKNLTFLTVCAFNAKIENTGEERDEAFRFKHWVARQPSDSDTVIGVWHIQPTVGLSL
jgi:hypothetical protein